MARPTVFIYHPDLHFIQTMSARLERHGIYVVGKTHLTGLQAVRERPTSARCLVVHLDWESLQPLQDSRLLGNPSQADPIPILLLVFDEALRNILSRRSLPRVKILRANILLDRLEQEILSALQRTSGATSALSEQNTVTLATGQLEGISPWEVLEFAARIRLTGRVVFSAEDREISLGFRNGKVTHLPSHWQGKPARWQELDDQNRGKFRVEYRCMTAREMRRLLDSSSPQTPLSQKDLLVDLFYFMHKHLENFATSQEIAFALQQALHRSSDPHLEGVHLIYQPQLQEKLRIIGAVDLPESKAILGIMRAVFEALAAPSPFPDLETFAESLEELKPLLQHLPLNGSPNKSQNPLTNSALMV
ncbi:MAG: hypothetical protein D6681_03160 [Calditrichaeota bacterium]|nr:MAG: hypothetical protein D6681_03160 [Calditrichota bacterium]